LVNKKSSLRGCPEHDCNRTQSFMHVQDLEVRQVWILNPGEEEMYLVQLRKSGNYHCQPGILFSTWHIGGWYPALLKLDMVMG